MRWPLTASLSILAAASFIWWLYWPGKEQSLPDNSSSPLVADIPDSGQRATQPSSPFSVNELDAVATNADSQQSNTASPAPILNEPGTEDVRQVLPIPSWDEALSDEQLEMLVAELKRNPTLLQQLVDEFRQVTDPDTKQQLASLLGEVGGEQATLLASELIFSGDSDARTLGMNLLQEIQPGNAEARDIVSGMLATEVEPRVLVEALTALASPGEVDAQSRAYLSDQVAWLASHQDDGVRSISLDILSRWSEDGRYTDVLLAGLDDTSEYVRSSAAYSLSGHEDKSPLVIERLLLTLRNTNEPRRVKRAAIRALRSMPLTADQSNEVDFLEKLTNAVTR